MYLLLLILFANEKWIKDKRFVNNSEICLIWKREKFGGKRRRVRQVEERARKKGGRFDKTRKRDQPTQRPREETRVICQ